MHHFNSLSVPWTDGVGVFAKPVLLQKREERSITEESRAATTLTLLGLGAQAGCRLIAEILYSISKRKKY